MEVVWKIIYFVAIVSTVLGSKQPTETRHKNSSHPHNLGIEVSGHVISYVEPLKCPKRFTRIGNACFQASAIRANWAEAQIYCRSMHKRADLASLVDPYESRQIKHYVRRDPERKLQSFWIGGSRVKDTEHWEWLSTRKRLSWRGDWYFSQPDNAENFEFCMMMDRRFDHQWNDMPCHIPYHFLCEIRDHSHRHRRRRLRKFLH